MTSNREHIEEEMDHVHREIDILERYRTMALKGIGLREGVDGPETAEKIRVQIEKGEAIQEQFRKILEEDGSGYLDSTYQRKPRVQE